MEKDAKSTSEPNYVIESASISRPAITITDIARMAGVSKKSVSRVINDESGVSDETRARIQTIMKENGYRPNRGARALANAQSFLLALAYNNPNPSYVLDILSGMQSVAGPKGYEIVMHEVQGAGPDIKSDLISFMHRSGCDGIVLTPPLSELPSMIGAFHDRSWKVARIAGDDVDLQQPQARFDDRAAALAVGLHLLDLGHTRLAFIGGDETSGPTRRRLAGLRDAISIRGHSLRAGFIKFGDFTFASGFKKAGELLKRKEPPTAIFCANDQMAAGALHAVRESGKRVPNHVSIVGFDNSPLAQQVWPPLTSVSQPVERMAEGVTRLLIDAINKIPLTQGRLEFTHTLSERSSTAPPQ